MNEIKMVVLISCMNQKNKEIIRKTNVQTDVVVVNQCDKNDVEDFEFTNKNGSLCHGRFINTTERGLSRSRNMAITNAWGDVCLICDDDEWLYDDIEKVIVEAYKKNGNASIITFAFDRKKKYSHKPKRLGFMGIVKTSSVEVTFKRDDVINAGVYFDIKMGSGSGNGAGEENKFLMDCYRHKMLLVYEPKVIGRLMDSKSLWFQGHDATYFRNWGWTTRRVMGGFKGALYMIYVLVFRCSLYSKDISFLGASKNMIRGYFEKR